MKKYFIVGLIAALSPNMSFGYSARINDLIAQKQAKMKQLEKCQGTTKNLKIAGLSTLGITAVGVGANIAEAVILNQYDDKISKAEKARDEAKTKYENKLNKQIEKEETAREEREKNTHECNSDETPSSFADAIKKANDSGVSDCKPKNNNKFNEHNCEATDPGVITCTLNINDQEHTYIHTFNVADQPCQIPEEKLIVDNIQDAEDKIKEVLKIQDINCDFDDNVATCYNNKNMFQRYKCEFKEIRSSSSDNGLKVYNTVSEFKDVHLNKSKAQEQFKRLVTWYADKKSDKYIDVDSCSKLVTANGQGSSRCNGKENNVYIFKFAAIDSTVSVKPSLVKYFCESSFNGKYKSVSRECTVANESVQACVEYIMNNKGTPNKCTPLQEEEQEANVSEIPVFKDSIRLFEAKNLDQATRLIKWYGKQNNESFETSKCKVTHTGAPGVYGNDHITCGEKRFVFKSLTAWADTAKKDLTEYFCKELSGASGSVTSGKCSGNDEYVQQCVNYVMGKGNKCLTTDELTNALAEKQVEAEEAAKEAAQKEKERKAAQKQIKENIRANDKARKDTYCPKVPCAIDSCYVTEDEERTDFWKVSCLGAAQPYTCFKKDDETTYAKYDCEKGITFENIKQRAEESKQAMKQAEENRKQLYAERKNKFCSLVGCPNATCYIEEVEDEDFLQLTCNGDSTKNGCFRENDLDTVYDCDSGIRVKKITRISGTWNEIFAKAQIELQDEKASDCERKENRFICGQGSREYVFDKITD